MRIINVAAAQMGPIQKAESREAVVQRMLALLAQAKARGADLVVYPESSLHMVTPVTRGLRVASFFWLQSMIRDAHARSLIFDLDTAIQALVGRIGRNDPEVLRLSAVYHNLIRYWAEV